MRRSLGGGALLLLPAVVSVHAQAPTTDAARAGPSQCTREACTLRVTARRWSSKEFLVRGLGADSTREAFTYDAIERAVAGSANATAELHRGDPWARVGTGVVLTSVLVGIVAGVDIIATTKPVVAGVLIASLAVPATALAGTVVALPFALVADRHRRKAVQVWNSELPP